MIKLTAVMSLFNLSAPRGSDAFRFWTCCRAALQSLIIWIHNNAVCQHFHTHTHATE